MSKKPADPPTPAPLPWSPPDTHRDLYTFATEAEKNAFAKGLKVGSGKTFIIHHTTVNSITLEWAWTAFLP